MARPKKSSTAKKTASAKSAETKSAETAVKEEKLTPVEEVKTEFIDTNTVETEVNAQLTLDTETSAEPVVENIASPDEKKSAKKTSAKKTATKKEPVEVVYILYLGSQLSSAELIERAKKESGVKNPKTVNVYVKPEDNKVYYVVDNNAGDFDLV